MPPTRTAIEGAVTAETQPLLSVRDLRVSFALDEGLVRAVDGTSFDDRIPLWTIAVQTTRPPNTEARPSRNGDGSRARPMLRIPRRHA